MSSNPTRLAAWVVTWLVAATCARAVGPVTLAEIKAPPAVAPDEPLAKAFSAEQATRYLDAAAGSWLKTRKCAACHTTIPYLMARTALARVQAPAPEVRSSRLEPVLAAAPDRLEPGLQPTTPDLDCPGD